MLSVMRRQMRKAVRRYRSGFANATSQQVAIVSSGYFAVKAIEIMPPIEVPWTSTFFRPSARTSAAPSSAQPSMVYGSRGQLDCP